MGCLWANKLDPSSIRHPHLLLSNISPLFLGYYQLVLEDYRLPVR